MRAENLPLEYLSIRVPEMLPAYRDLMRISHGLISRAFSNEVIRPGMTTTADRRGVVAAAAVPEWDGQPLRSAQEEDAAIDEDGRVSWVLERQTRYHLVH